MNELALSSLLLLACLLPGEERINLTFLPTATKATQVVM